MKKIIRLTESELVRIVRKLINEQPGKIIGQKLVRPVLNWVRGQGGKQISNVGRYAEKIKYLRNQEKLFLEKEALLMAKLRNKEINAQQFASDYGELLKKYDIENVRNGITKLRQQINIEKNRMVVANTPQENIIKSRYDAIRGKDIRQGGSNNLGVFELGDGNVAKLSDMGWNDPGIRNLKWKDRIKSPRVMKTVQVRSFINSEGKEVVYQVQQKATGRPMNKLTKTEIEKIPEIHKINFKKDLEELYRNNVFVDPNPENFLYDPNKGIQFIDLGGIQKYKHTSAEKILDVLLKK